MNCTICNDTGILKLHPTQAGYRHVDTTKEGRRVWRLPDGSLFIFPNRSNEVATLCSCKLTKALK